MRSIASLVAIQDIDPSLKSEAESLIWRALESSKRSLAPRFVHTCGIPGAGKTTYAASWLNGNPTFATVQFDAIMESLPGYQKDKQSSGVVRAFQIWELPARVIGYHLLDALIEGNRDVFFDHSAINLTHVDLICAIQKRGYHVEMHYLECSINIALERVLHRETIIQRHTPEQLIFERHKLLQELLPVYQKLVDRFLTVGTAEKTKPTFDHVQSSLGSTKLVSSNRF